MFAVCSWLLFHRFIYADMIHVSHRLCLHAIGSAWNIISRVGWIQAVPFGKHGSKAYIKSFFEKAQWALLLDGCKHLSTAINHLDICMFVQLEWSSLCCCGMEENICIIFSNGRSFVSGYAASVFAWPAPSLKFQWWCFIFCGSSIRNYFIYSDQKLYIKKPLFYITMTITYYACLVVSYSRNKAVLKQIFLDRITLKLKS